MPTKDVNIRGKIRWAKLLESNRDMGLNLPEGSDQRVKLERCQGQFVLDLFVTPEERAKAIKAGVPKTGMTGQRWKETDEGEHYYRAVREHYNPNFGEVLGPPQVYDEEENYWDWETRGLIGNDSEVILRLSVYTNPTSGSEKTTIKALKMVNHVEYVKPEVGGWD